MRGSTRTAGAFAALLLGAVAAVAGCKASGDEPGYIVMPGMVRPVPYEAFDDNPVAVVGMLKPPDGTVPFGGFSPHMGKGVPEAERAGRELVNPIENTPAAVTRGQGVYTTFCAVCHGANGEGATIGRLTTAKDGPAALMGITGPGLKSFVNTYPDGRLFHVVSRGGPAIMPSYAVQISAVDRWRLVHYLRSAFGPYAPPAASAAGSAEPAASASAEPAATGRAEPAASGSAETEPAASASAEPAASASAEPSGAPSVAPVPPTAALPPPATAPAAPSPTEKSP